MRPDKVRSSQKEVLEHDITEGFQQMTASRGIEDDVGEKLAEKDMNDALEEYRDLARAIGRTAT